MEATILGCCVAKKNSVGPCDTSRVPQAAPPYCSTSHVATNNERAYYEYTNELIDSFAAHLSLCVLTQNDATSH